VQEVLSGRAEHVVCSIAGDAPGAVPHTAIILNPCPFLHTVHWRCLIRVSAGALG
jgi:hypothetical protein